MEGLCKLKIDVFSSRNRSSTLWASKWSLFRWSSLPNSFEPASTRRCSSISDRHHDRNWLLGSATRVQMYTGRTQQLSTSRIRLQSKQHVYCCLLCHANHPRVPKTLPQSNGIGLWWCRRHEPRHSSCGCCLRHSLSTITQCLDEREIDHWESGVCWWTRNTGSEGGNTTSCGTPPSFLCRPYHRWVQCFCAACSAATNTLTTSSPGRKTHMGGAFAGYHARVPFSPSCCCTVFSAICCPNTTSFTWIGSR